MLHNEETLRNAPPGIYDRLEAVRDEILGPEHERAPDLKYVDGELRGGIQFERCEHRSNPVDEGTRCYQYQGLSTEKPRSVSSVNINSKMPDDTPRVLRTRILKVCI